MKRAGGASLLCYVAPLHFVRALCTTSDQIRAHSSSTSSAASYFSGRVSDTWKSDAGVLALDVKDPFALARAPPLLLPPPPPPPLMRASASFSSIQSARVSHKKPTVKEGSMRATGRVRTSSQWNDCKGVCQLLECNYWSACIGASALVRVHLELSQPSISASASVRNKGERGREKKTKQTNTKIRVVLMAHALGAAPR